MSIQIYDYPFWPIKHFLVCVCVSVWFFVQDVPIYIFHFIHSGTIAQTVFLPFIICKLLLKKMNTEKKKVEKNIFE